MCFQAKSSVVIDHLGSMGKVMKAQDIRNIKAKRRSNEKCGRNVAQILFDDLVKLKDDDPGESPAY